MLNKSPKADSYFGPIFWLHLILIVLAYSSPFLVSWWLITAGILALWIQYAILGGCVLTKAEFGNDPNTTFYSAYLEKIGIKTNAYKLKILVRYIMPFIVLTIALIWQVWFGNRPFWI